MLSNPSPASSCSFAGCARLSRYRPAVPPAQRHISTVPSGANLHMPLALFSGIAPHTDNLCTRLVTLSSQHASESVNMVLIGTKADMVEQRKVETSRGQLLADEYQVSPYCSRIPTALTPLPPPPLSPRPLLLLFLLLLLLLFNSSYSLSLPPSPSSSFALSHHLLPRCNFLRLRPSQK
jgi:hypothetical protein